MTQAKLIQASGLPGGSKEAFHLVYQAFETLADPEARKRYDNNQLEGPKKAKKQKMRPKKSAANPKDGAQRPAKQTSFAKPQVSEKKKLSQADVQKTSVEKLLAKLYAILKVLPRDVRNEVISKEFSQKQRVLFEEWIVNQREAETQEASAEVIEGEPKPAQSAPSMAHEPSDGSCTALTLKQPKDGPTPSWTNEPPEVDPVALKSTKLGASKLPAKRNKRKGEMRGISQTFGKTYRATVVIDMTQLFTFDCDLPTALEFLVILTSTKQKMNGGDAASASFESRLQEALEQSAQEHGRRGSQTLHMDGEDNSLMKMVPLLPLFHERNVKF